MTIEVLASHILTHTGTEDIGDHVISSDITSTGGGWFVLYDYATHTASLHRLDLNDERVLDVPCSFSQDDISYLERMAKTYGDNYSVAANEAV